MSGPHPRPLQERFWNKVKKTETCWLWIGGTDGCGYGKISDEAGKFMRANRISWLIHFGDIPSGLLVLHRCDNPPCVRPDHLWLGTQADNMCDAARKGRTATGDNHGSRIHPEAIERGEKRWNAKLTTEAVKEIRGRYAAGNISILKLSKEFNVCTTKVFQIIRRKSWIHVL